MLQVSRRDGFKASNILIRMTSVENLLTSHFSYHEKVNGVSDISRDNINMIYSLKQTTPFLRFLYVYIPRFFFKFLEFNNYNCDHSSNSE